VAIRDIDLLPVDERRRVVHDFNATATDLGPPATLQELFSAQVCRTPAAVALESGNEILSYAELACRVNRLARFLRSRGVGRDVPVAVCMERSVEMVVALLGIVTAGGAYLPLDPEVPPARLSTMLTSASPPVVLVQERFRDRVAGDVGSAAGEVFQVDAQRQELAAFDDGPLDDIASPEDLAYVIYTSGSTGAPKGVMNTHAGIVNRLRWMQDAYGIDAADRVLQKTPFGFDVSVWEFFWPLLTGARIVMAPPGLHREPAALADLVAAAGITVIHFVPSMLEVFLDGPDLERTCRSLRHVFASGEALGEAAMSHCLRRIPARLHNLYGPTEAAVDVTYHECRRDDPPGPVPIGRPIANMRTYVLDAALRPVGVGIDGELWLAGVGVARGYLGRPDLTAERFLPDPFFERPGERMYRTGDLARWRHDGEIEYLGRLDHQVKIRGVRIELGEIEAELERIEGVTRGVVIDREFGPGDRRLVAYLIADPSAPNDEALKLLLAERLPEAMVPWRFVRVDALPVNANGKLDRAALPSPDAAIDAVEASPRSAPVGETEEALAAIWCELLGIPTVGRDDGFFARGGHSLLSMRLVAAIERRFGVRLPVKTVFEAPKLAELAARISQPPAALPESAVALTTIPASAEVIDCRPLPAQRGMWLLHSLLPDPATYNVPIAWRVDGPIDWPRMERSLAAVVARHPALRTSLVEVDGDLVQRVLPTAAVAVPWRVVTIAEESGLQAALEHEASTPFDLAVAPLLRAVRIDIAGAEPVLMLTFHHAIIDEWSIGIVRADLAAAYAAADAFDDRSLPVVTSARDSVDIERDRRFWREELAAAPVETPLPGRAVAAVVESSRGMTSRFTVERDALDRLRGLAERSGVTVFNVLLASVHAWLKRITGQRDLVIGTPVATRGAAETTAAVGCLINVLPVRVRFDEGTSADPLTLPGLAERVQGIFLRALDHADLPFDQIVAAAMPTRQGSRQPLVNVLLTVVETGNRAWRIGAATLRPEPIEAGRARFDLSLTLEIGPDGLEGSLEFPPDRYDADVVAGFAARYAALLAEAAARPTVPIERMAMLPDADRRRVIEEFNETEVDLGGATTLHQLVQEQTARTPSACAVREGEAQITYDALQQRAARLATRLRGLGIGSGDRVGIALPRSIDATVAMLAVLRSGAAWVPLDREAPPARLAFIVDDAQLSAIIDSHHAAGGWPEGIPAIDPAAADLGDRVDDDFPDVAPGAAAYVMYTSGSTGQPKGVVIPHAAVVNYLRGKQRRFPLDAADICLHATRTTFDISVYEVFGPLLAGAAVVVLPAGRTDPARIAELVRSAAVTVAQFVPSLLALLVDDETFTACPTLRRVFCGGEAMPSGLMDRFLDRSDAELVNVYGPTEATVWATAWVCRRSERAEMPPIGRPLDNVRCYVLDAGCRPVPVGTVGELFIGGAQLAIGYHHRPDLTAARFLPDPFLPGPGERMYRTGDVCRWRPDGLLEFVARNDTQVKIRGHRIEPAEIEACLAGHPQIGAVAVVAITPAMAVMPVMPVMADGTLSLVAAVVPRESGLDVETLRRWTAERLPEVMVPSRFVCLDALPVNANGKIDRRALAGQIAESSVGLPAPLPQATGSPGVVPVFLSQVRAAWQRLFGRADFGDQDNFFHDLGGQSIMAARLVADLSTVLGRRVPLAAVFEAPTVASMAALLRDEGWTPRFRSSVPLQPLGVGTPVFLFHGVGGGVTENLELARAFAPDVPVYGLQAIDRDGGAMQTSLGAFAELYAAEIVAFQPRGPYFLGGFSLGGWFAYETAQQLRRGGHEVALLALFDTDINCLLPDAILAAADRVLWMQYVWKHLRRLASQPSQGWRYLRGIPARFKLARQWRAVDPIRGDSHGALVARHRALPYAGSIDYFQSADSLPAVLGVWKRWCAGGLTVHQLPGDHHEVIFGANAATIANIVRGIRGDRARQAGSPAEPAERRQV
jgi:amino acid adenylation domain-containing protein